MTDLSEEDLAHCRLLAEIEAGILEPHFVRVPDGFYTRRVVLDRIEVGMFHPDDPPTEAEWREEPCRVPRYRSELRYRRTG